MENHNFVVRNGKLPISMAIFSYVDTTGINRRVNPQLVGPDLDHDLPGHYGNSQLQPESEFI